MTEDSSISSQSKNSAEDSTIVFCSDSADDSRLVASYQVESDASDSLECLPRLSQLTSRMSSVGQKITSGGLSAADKMTHSLDQLSGMSILELYDINSYLCYYYHNIYHICSSVTGEIIDSVTQLQGLAVIGGDDIEKQKKQAKSIDLQKRKALAMLLKTLSSIGASYVIRLCSVMRL